MMSLKTIALKILLIIFLNGCQSPAKKLKLVTLQCAIVVEDDGSAICMCRDYKFSYEYIGATSKPYPESMELCEQMVGYPEYDKVSAFNEKVWRAIRNAK